MQRRAEALAAGEATARPRLGIALAPRARARRMRAAVGLPERDGLLVAGSSSDSPAAKAGLERGDLLVGVNGRPCPRSMSCSTPSRRRGARARVLRGTEERTVDVHFSS